MNIDYVGKQNFCYFITTNWIFIDIKSGMKFYLYITVIEQYIMEFYKL